MAKGNGREKKVREIELNNGLTKTMFSKEWLHENLIIETDEINSNFYESVNEVYRTGLSDSFLATIINGVFTPARFLSNPGEHKYNALIRQLKSLVSIDESTWFYYTLIDNTVGNLNFVKEFNYLSPAYALEYFQLEPAAQGGTSWLGLIANDCSWLLLHEFEPDEHFAISFCSGAKLTSQLVSKLYKGN